MQRHEFDAFYEENYPRLVAAIALLTDDPDVARDSVDEAFTRAWERLRRGRTIESLGAWTRVVALNTARERFRKRKIERRARGHGLFAETVAQPRDVALSVDVQRALDALPRRQREVTVLYYFLDLPVDTIAHELGIAPGAVKASLHFARRKLAERLGDRAPSSEATNVG